MEAKASWVNTTHDWTGSVDAEHLAYVRQRPEECAPGGSWHLVLEVLAYAADEATSNGEGRCAITFHPDGSVSVGARHVRHTRPFTNTHAVSPSSPATAGARNTADAGPPWSVTKKPARLFRMYGLEGVQRSG